MSSAKTLARAGSSLLGRLLASPSPLRAGLPPPSLLSRIQPLVPPPPPRPETTVEAYEAQAVARLSSLPGEISFPCGLPSLRFIIEDGTVLSSLVRMAAALFEYSDRALALSFLLDQW
jgi:large subunit ribosomal protein L34